jgi:hypothetical protein
MEKEKLILLLLDLIEANAEDPRVWEIIRQALLEENESSQ